MESKRQNLRIALAAIWLALTSALTLWWMVFAFKLISQIDIENSKHRTMLFWEGATLLGLLLAGGLTLIYFILQDKKHADQLKLFFAGFTHDVKTRLAGVKLQTEGLRADNFDEKFKGQIERLLTDTSRLQVQVENSLFFNSSTDAKLFIEEINVNELFHFIFDSWPQLKITVQGQAKVFADRRCFESIVTNILHNSISHGDANIIQVQIEKASANLVRITFADNGSGFRGESARLGEKFYRFNPSSGSGLGLFTAKESLQRMCGKIGFVAGDSNIGFVVYIELPGSLL